MINLHLRKVYGCDKRNKKNSLGNSVLSLFFILLCFNALYSQQSSTVIYKAAKLVAKADLFEFLGDSASFCSVDEFKCYELESIGFDNVLFIKVEYRDVKKLKFILQKEILGISSNGNLFDFSETIYEEKFKERFGSLDSVENIGFYERQLGEYRFRNNSIHFQCDYILAYAQGRFYRLKGFRYNEFVTFFYKVCSPGSRNLHPGVNIELEKIQRSKNLDKVKLNLLHISELDMRGLYKRHVRKREYRDGCSCVRLQENWLIPK